MSDASSVSSTPGSGALESLRRRDEHFKAPYPKKKKAKQKILTEEKYVEEMAKIIERDFFPDLHKLRAQNEYLDAMDRKDYDQMEVIRAKFTTDGPRSESRPAMTPATFETPLLTSNPSECGSVSDTPRSTMSHATNISGAESIRSGLSAKHSLDSFLQAYTSEDNYSFQEMIDTADRKLRQKFSVLYNEERLSAEKLARALTLPTIEEQFQEPDPMRTIETWSYKNINSIMFIPDGVELTKDERIAAAKAKQSIQHNATRLSINPVDNASRKTTCDMANNHATNGKIGVDGHVVNSNEKEAPQIRGFHLVRTPSPHPGVAFSPLMTWGEIEGTPFRLDGSDTPIHSNAGPSFKINESSRRETIALALAEKVGEKMRAQKQRAMNTARKNINSPFVRSKSERLACMSPAARRLATTKLGLRGSVMTPSPAPNLGIQSRSSRRSGSTKSTPIKSNNATPVFNSSIIKLDTTTSSLTNDLLKIPISTKRPTASDFF